MKERMLIRIDQYFEVGVRVKNSETAVIVYMNVSCGDESCSSMTAPFLLDSNIGWHVLFDMDEKPVDTSFTAILILSLLLVFWSSFAAFSLETSQSLPFSDVDADPSGSTFAVD